MTTAAIKQVNSKLKNLPDELLEEVEKYIDFLTYRYTQDSLEVPQWQKDIVLKRMEKNEDPVDAFDMINDLEA